MVPEEVAQREDIGGVAGVLYGVIANRVKNSLYDHPGILVLCGEVGKGWRTVKRALAQLVAAKLIVISPRGRCRSPVYSLGEAAPQTTVETSVVTTDFPTVVTTDTTAVVTTDATAVVGAETPSCIKKLKEHEREGESGLFPFTLDFARWAEEEEGARFSEKVMWAVNPIAAKKVPAGYVKEKFRAYWRKMKPWDFATFVIDEWRRDKKYYRRTKD